MVSEMTRTMAYTALTAYVTAVEVATVAHNGTTAPQHAGSPAPSRWDGPVFIAPDVMMSVRSWVARHIVADGPDYLSTLDTLDR
jgi:hypothetical protein